MTGGSEGKQERESSMEEVFSSLHLRHIQLVSHARNVHFRRRLPAGCGDSRLTVDTQ